MIQYRDRQRQKAFIGAIIGAAASNCWWYY